MIVRVSGRVPLALTVRALRSRVMASRHCGAGWWAMVRGVSLVEASPMPRRCAWLPFGAWITDRSMHKVMDKRFGACTVPTMSTARPTPISADLPTANAALAASKLPVSATTVRRLLGAGRVSGAVRIGSRWHCTPEALIAALVHDPAASIAHGQGAPITA